MPTKPQKILAENKSKKHPELTLNDKAISSFTEIPDLPNLTHLTRLSLAHNKIKSLPPSISNLKNLTHLTLFNNNLQDLPSSLVNLDKLISLNLGMNKLSNLPRMFCFGSHNAAIANGHMDQYSHEPSFYGNLQVLELSYNNLNENTLPDSLFDNRNLRALYLSDNDFEYLPQGLQKLSQTLEVLALRSNDLIALPNYLGDFTNLKELILCQNRLVVLPPEFSNLKQFKETSRNYENTCLDLEGNHFVLPLMHKMGDIGGLLDYIRESAYIGPKFFDFSQTKFL